MNDYRIKTHDQLIELYTRAEEADPNAKGWEAIKGYVRWAPPTDRQGLIAIIHDQCMRTEDQVAELNLLAKQVAKQTNQRVYHVFTESRWNILLFALDDGSYDENEDGKYANDQYIAYYDPDGTYKLVGVS